MSNNDEIGYNELISSSFCAPRRRTFMVAVLAVRSRSARRGRIACDDGNRSFGGLRICRC